jgi:biotin carboxyl carrier protein
MTYEVGIDGRIYRLELTRGGDRWSCRLDEREITVDAVLVQHDVLSILIGGIVHEVKREVTPSETYIWIAGERYMAEVRDPRSFRSRRGKADATQGTKELRASMPGKVVRVLVREMAEVQVGDTILVVEAMKMQNELKSPKQGVVKKILASAGSAVNAGDVLAIVE